MSELGDFVSRQEELWRRRLENGHRLEQLAADRLREFRDLLVARQIPPDEVYSLTKTEEWAFPTRSARFRKADPPYKRAVMDLFVCRKGWVVSEGNVGSEYTHVTGGLYVAENAKLYGYVTRVIGWSEGGELGLSRFPLTPPAQLRQSAYFMGNHVLISTGAQAVHTDHGFGLESGLEELAAASMRYSRSRGTI